MALDAFDRALIAATQAGLPLVPRPYDAVGATLGVSGERVRQRLAELLTQLHVAVAEPPWPRVSTPRSFALMVVLLSTVMLRARILSVPLGPTRSWP